ncbi:HNH endonuclease [Azohydromonas australica]|uniref:HNH endonuclease n=1 Tax=Azohydromonas australica TaxID=364039 RepID=UPI001EE40B19|nr:HNH endonuclease signature motif containing protein [Azohydromonas australica]
MNPEKEAIPLIESLSEELGIDWINTDRTSDDWKVKLYEQPSTGKQLAIYDRKSTLLRLEHPAPSIPGVLEKDQCPKSDALSKFARSRFKDRSGFCVEVENKVALQELLSRYFGAVNSVSTAALGSVLAVEATAPKTSVPAKTAPDDARAARLARLAAAPRKPQKMVVERTEFARNPDVVAEVLYRAQGYCESCHAPAPFVKATNGEPYLEVHHVVPLAEDGDDTVDNAQALCPNCHREAHFG